MEVRLTDQQESELSRLAASVGKSPSELIEEAVDSYIAGRTDFLEAVDRGLASLDRGASVSHESVGRRLDRALS